MSRHRIGFCSARDGVRLACSVTGKGEPVLFIKSFWGHLENDLTNPVWRHMLATLSERNSLVRYDCRGTGLSDRQVENQSFETLIEDAEAVIDHLGVKRFAVLGHVGAGPIAVAVAARRPDMVTKLIIHGGYVRARYERDRKWSLLGDSFVELVRDTWDEHQSIARRMMIAAFIPDSPKEVQEAFEQGARDAAVPHDVVRIAAANYAMDARPFAPAVRCPTLILQPMHNNLLFAALVGTPLDEAPLLASLIPGARLVPLTTRNHIILEHEPAWESWRSEVVAFLAGPGKQSEVFRNLSPRENELMLLLSRGLDNAQIAARLAITEKTVRNHITHIFAKLGVETRAQAIVLAQEAGLRRDS